MSNEYPWNDLTVCTFSTGKIMVREVLNDWLFFIGNQPRELIFSVSPKDNPPVIYEQLKAERIIDKIIYLETENRSVGEIEPHGIRLAIESATTEWILLVKLDALPFRKGHENWLKDAIDAIEKYDCFGLTGSGTYHDIKPLDSNYGKIQKYSNNFSLFQRDNWLKIHDEYIGKDFNQNWVLESEFTGPKLRFATEGAVEDFLEKNSQHMLVRLESPNWSVFHVNVWGEQLQKVRQAYLNRENITPYLNQGKPARENLMYPWDKYYGYPKPSISKRLKISLGRWRRKFMKL